jgi:hypothetical protein
VTVDVDAVGHLSDQAGGRGIPQSSTPLKRETHHIEDAASGTVAAIERGRPGEIHHVTDDEPAADARRSLAAVGLS